MNSGAWLDPHWPEVLSRGCQSDHQRWVRGQSPLPKELCSKNQVTQESMTLRVPFWVPQCKWTPKHPARLRISGFP